MPEQERFLYWYRARITREHWRHPVYDGDSLRIDIDLGLSTWKLNEPIRLYGIDCPELHEEGGEEARDYVRSLLSEGDEIVVRTYKDRTGKYGRYLADVYLEDGTHLNEHLIEKGYATQYLEA